MNLFDFFDKCFLINLDRREDRIRLFSNQVNKYNLGNYARISAIDGNTLDLLRFPRGLKPGEIGLIMTVLNIIQEAKNKKYEKILIIEDDCLFSDDILNYQDYMSQLPDDWDMFYFGGNHNTHAGYKAPVSVNEKFVKLHHTFTTHFVGIKNTVFSEIEQTIKNFTQPLDVSYIKLQNKYNVYCTKKTLATQMKGHSDILNHSVDYSYLIK